MERSADTRSPAPVGRCAVVATAVGYAVCLAPAAEAYVGPGAGMGVLGVVLAVVAALFMALVGMVLWPIRMVAHRRKLKARESASGTAAADQREGEAEPESATGRT